MKLIKNVNLLLKIDLPSALCSYLGGGLFGPASVGGGASWAGVENFSDADIHFGQGLGGAFFSEAADGDKPFGFKDLHDAAQVRIARIHQRAGLGDGEFVWGAIATGIFYESERAMVDNKVIGKKFFRRGEAFAEEAPKAAPADFAAGAGEAVDGALGVFAGGFPDVGINAEPIAGDGDFTEGHAGLRHAEGAGVHAEKHDALRCGAAEVDVLFVRGPCVVEGVVHVGHGIGEGEGVANRAQVAGGVDYFFGDHLRCLQDVSRTGRTD